MPHDEATIARAKSFESGAEAYDEFRPGYPDALFDDVLTYARMRSAKSVLEIGSGTGKATIPLARRGLDVTAVEPAEAMAQLLTSRAEDAGVGNRVRVRVTTFEDLGGADGPFGLVAAAQSFHWTDPASRWQRMHDVLAPSGAVALFWNNWHLDPTAHDLDAVRRTYETMASDLLPDLPSPQDGDPWRHEIAANSGLTDALERTYGWTWELTPTDYLTLLSTTSQYAVAGDSVRAALFTELETMFEGHVQLQGTTKLHLIRKA